MKEMSIGGCIIEINTAVFTNNRYLDNVFQWMSNPIH